MPSYDYKCNTCDTSTTLNRSMTDSSPNPDCPQCRTPMARSYGVAAVTFKGQGWYSTDSKSK